MRPASGVLAIVLAASGTWSSVAAVAAAASAHRTGLRRAGTAVGAEGQASSVAELSDTGFAGGASMSGSVTAAILRKVTEEQVILLSRLARLDQAVSATLARAMADKQTAAEADKALRDVKERTEKSKGYSEGTAKLVEQTAATQKKAAEETKASLTEISESFNTTDKALNESGKAAEVSTVKNQVDDNKRLLDRLGPRLIKLSQRLEEVEGVLQKGNISAVVNDASKVAMSDVLRDMNRGMYQLLNS